MGLGKGKILERERATTLKRSTRKTLMTTVAQAKESMTIPERKGGDSRGLMATKTLIRREKEKKEGTMMTPEWEETLEWTKEGALTTMTTMVRANGGNGGDANDNSGKEMGKGGDSEKRKQEW
jgi:hypothetical protein